MGPRGGEPKIIAAVLEQPVLENILTHLGLQARAPPRAPACDQALQAEPFKDRHTRVEGRVRGAMGKEEGRLN